MSRTTLIIIALAVVFLAAVGFALYHLDDTGDREVVNRYRGGAFSFTYPLGFEIEEYPNGSIAIGSTTSSGFGAAVNLTVAQASVEDGYENFDAFLMDELMRLCTTGTPTTGVACTGVERQSSYKNESGQQVTEYHLVLTADGTTSTYGPIYAYTLFPDEDHVTGVPYPIVFVHAPLSSVRAGTVDEALLSRITNSVVAEQR